MSLQSLRSEWLIFSWIRRSTVFCAPAFADMAPQLKALQDEKEPVPATVEPLPIAPELMIQAGLIGSM